MELANQEGVQVQKGMNFGIKKNYSIVLMSTAKGSPYNDRLLDDGVIEYEGHDGCLIDYLGLNENKNWWR